MKQKSKKSKLIYLLGLCLFMFVIVYMTQNYLYSGRMPASIQSTSLFSFITKESPLKDNLYNDIINGIQIKPGQKDFQIKLANLTLKTTSQTDSLCNLYENYTLTFEAEGIASSGERPSLSISSPCTSSSEKVDGLSVSLPFASILKMDPSDKDIQVSENSNFSFRNISDNWPEYWVLSKIELRGKDNIESVTINRKDIYQLSKKPLTMNWE